MKPSYPLYIHTIRAYAPGGDNEKVSFLSICKHIAVSKYKDVRGEDFTNWNIEASRPTCEGKYITEVHCLRYGSKFKSVHKGGISRDFNNNEYYSKSPVLTKYDYNPVNHSYLCLDGEGNKYYIDAYEWCITEEEK